MFSCFPPGACGSVLVVYRASPVRFPPPLSTGCYNNSLAYCYNEVTSDTDTGARQPIQKILCHLRDFWVRLRPT
jgi:hypothetical protein